MIKIIIIFCIQFAAFEFVISQETSERKMEPRPPEILERYGYPAETHYVTTEDGYILTLYRIPHGKSGSSENIKGVVLLQHGLFATAADWVILGPKKGFAYQLADAGFDVWLGNSRGTDYSQNHTRLDPKVSPGPFWDFDWNEMGLYDLPANTNYILGETGASEILYAGHSQGTTQLLVSSSTYPDLKEKIRAAFLLAPIAYLCHSINPFLQLLAKSEVLARAGVELTENAKFAFNEGLIGIINDLTCGTALTANACLSPVFFEGGHDETQIEDDDVPIINHYAPADISTRQAIHYFQDFNCNGFRKFDYGPDKNLELYGDAIPPSYNLSAINIPIYAYVGPSDSLTVEADRDILFSQLDTLKKVVIIDYPPYDHNDFLYAKDAPTLCYGRVIDDMDSVLEVA